MTDDEDDKKVKMRPAKDCNCTKSGEPIAPPK